MGVCMCVYVSLCVCIGGTRGVRGNSDLCVAHFLHKGSGSKGSGSSRKGDMMTGIGA